MGKFFKIQGVITKIAAIDILLLGIETLNLCTLAKLSVTKITNSQYKGINLLFARQSNSTIQVLFINDEQRFTFIRNCFLLVTITIILKLAINVESMMVLESKLILFVELDLS